MTDFFTDEEKTCHCGCGLNLVDQNPDFLKALNSARELYGLPMDATCMTRCPAHNAEIGGAAQSAHMDGRAAAIAVHDPGERMHMIRCFIAAGFHRIEVSAVHIHVDAKRGARDVFLLKTGEGIV